MTKRQATTELEELFQERNTQNEISKMATSLETLAKHPKIFQDQNIQDEISKMAASLETLARLPRLRSEAWIRTNKQNNERLETLAKRPKISTKTFDDLPDEVLLKICGYLSIKNIVQCSGVSKRVRRVCHDKSLWEKINLYGKVVPSEFIEQILANGCTYLNLHGAQIKGTLSLPQKTYQLKYLNIERLKANAKSVQKLLSCNFSIERMSLSGLKLSKKILYSINNENLKVLDLSCCSGLTIDTDTGSEESIDKVLKCESSLKKLMELNLCFIEILSKCDKLIELSLWFTEVLLDCPDLINRLVNNIPPNLKKLSLGGFCLLDDHVKVIANRCKKLTELDLYGTYKGPVTNKSITYIVEKLPELVKLDVSLTKVGITALIELKSLSNLKILNCQHLDLWITNDEIESLISQLPNITILVSMTSESDTTLNIASPSDSIEGKDGIWDIAAKQIDLFSNFHAGKKKCIDEA